MVAKIKKGDEVIVVAGKEKGKVGKILKVFPKDSQVLVANINKSKRHQRASMAQAAGIVEKEMPIHISNVMILDPKNKKPTRVGVKLVGDKKVRFAKLSGEVLE